MTAPAPAPAPQWPQGSGFEPSLRACPGAGALGRRAQVADRLDGARERVALDVQGALPVRSGTLAVLLVGGYPSRTLGRIRDVRASSNSMRRRDDVGHRDS